MAEPVEDSISILMQNVLDGIVSVFQQSGVTLPSRQYIAVGQVAHDCEQVTVSFVQMYLGGPGDQAETPQRCEAPRSAVLACQIVRKLPEPEPRAMVISQDALTSITQTQTRDAWLLMDAGTQAVDDFLGVIADVSVTAPQGGYQATVLNLVIGVP